MHFEDTVCHCHHVSLGKLWRFARRVQPPRASGLSECLGAGTGCGWCIPLLKQIHNQAVGNQTQESTGPPAGPTGELAALSPEDCMRQRGQYLEAKRASDPTFE